MHQQPLLAATRWTVIRLRVNLADAAIEITNAQGEIVGSGTADGNGNFAS